MLIFFTKIKKPPHIEVALMLLIVLVTGDLKIYIQTGLRLQVSKASRQQR